MTVPSARTKRLILLRGRVRYCRSILCRRIASAGHASFGRRVAEREPLASLRPPATGDLLHLPGGLGSYFCVSNKVDQYRVRAEECRLKAARVEDNARRIHWLEAAARWVELGRQDGKVLPTSDSATVAKRHDAVKSSAR